MYFSLDQGANWQSLMTNLPSSPMYWMDIPTHFNDLVVGTYGRGIWILDDLTPLQQFTTEVEESAVHLFNPKDAYRLQSVSMVMQFFKEASFGDDPPRGTSLHYWQSEELADSVSIIIANEKGETIRTIKHKGKPGINRVWWDFREDPSTALVLRTKPLYAPWVQLSEKRTRKSLVPPMSLLASPGTYTLSLKVGDIEQSQSLTLLKDPNTEGSLSDIAAQKELLDKIRLDYEEISKTVNEAEKIRRQLKDMLPMLTGDKAHQVQQLDSLATALENQMVQLKHTGKGQDAIRLPGMLMEKLNYLASTVGIADFKPADQYVEVYQQLHAEWKTIQKAWNQFKKEEMAAFQNKMQNNAVGPLIFGSQE